MVCVDIVFECRSISITICLPAGELFYYTDKFIGILWDFHYQYIDIISIINRNNEVHCKCVGVINMMKILLFRRIRHLKYQVSIQNT